MFSKEMLKEKTIYYDYEDYLKEFKDIDFNKDIFLKIIERFVTPPEVIKIVYNRVIELNQEYPNIHECISIVQNEFQQKEYKLDRLIREIMNRK